MRLRAILISVTFLLSPLALGLTFVRTKSMTENYKYLHEAQTAANGFEEKRAPELLRQAYSALANVSLSAEKDFPDRIQLRKTVLHRWLCLLAQLDRHLDPNFNPEDMPQLVVAPPITKGDVLHRPGVNPVKIKEPQARAQYEAAIAANQTKSVNYNLQTDLRRIDERINHRIKIFIMDSYAATIDDQREINLAIESDIQSPQRKAQLLKLSK